LLYRTVAGPGPRDPASERLPSLPSPAGRKLWNGWFAGLQDESVNPEVAAAVRECADLLAGDLCEILPQDARYDIGPVRRVWATVGAADAAPAVEMHPGRWRTKASARSAAAAKRAPGLTALDYVRALDQLSEVRGRVADAWGDADCFLCPSAASPAWPVDDEFPV
jgi:Asp-tRNA(Asn)/Glu-tRNA(Gln) amidotransferase A subunit family amidase